MQLQNDGVARSALADAHEKHRGWEWHYLHSQLDGARLVLHMPSQRIDALVMNKSGRQIAVRSLGQNEVNLYDVATGKLDTVLRGHSVQVT